MELHYTQIFTLEHLLLANSICTTYYQCPGVLPNGLQGFLNSKRDSFNLLWKIVLRITITVEEDSLVQCSTQILLSYEMAIVIS